MAMQDQSAPAEFVRKHHVHYEVEPEQTGEGDGREVVAMRVRLLATHDREPLPTPACEACVALLGELRAFAERLAADAGLGKEEAETIPATRKLYQSSDDRDNDEVALTVRVRCNDPADRKTGEDRKAGPGSRDRCAARLCEALGRLGAARG